MKKNKAILAAILMAASVSSAQETVMDSTLLSTGVTIGFTSAPTATLALSSYDNDILMVNQDAVIAAETGFVSDSLASVIEMLKASEAQLAEASDAQVIRYILDLNAK